MPKQPLHKHCGSFGLSHFSIPVRDGKLAEVVSLFVDEFDWSEIPERLIKADWGEVRAVSPNGESPYVQLTEEIGEIPDQDMIPVVHLAVDVADPWSTIFFLEAWAVREGTPIEIEALGNEKYFVRLPRLLAVQLELVPLNAKLRLKIVENYQQARQTLMDHKCDLVLYPHGKNCVLLVENGDKVEELMELCPDSHYDPDPKPAILPSQAIFGYMNRVEDVKGWMLEMPSVELVS